ncbi:MAG: deoxyribose-phosphate aldolase [Bacteroidales bacterium]
MVQFGLYKNSFENIKHSIDIILSGVYAYEEKRKLLSKIMSLIDLTSLEGSDNDNNIIAVCKKAKGIKNIEKGLPNVAAVCFYPTFVALAKSQLPKSYGINVASVAGAFPSGQSPLKVKLEEVKYAVDQGADEIDMVIHRGKFLAGEFEHVHDEIAAIKELCGEVKLKVILETGELQSVQNIRKASELAINAGADFIKTSTGKVQPAATVEAFYIMAETVKEYFDLTGKKIGLKPAGGIYTSEQALNYYRIVNAVLEKGWLHKNFFRIGASRLVDNILDNFGNKIKK